MTVKRYRRRNSAVTVTRKGRIIGNIGVGRNNVPTAASEQQPAAETSGEEKQVEQRCERIVLLWRLLPHDDFANDWALYGAWVKDEPREVQGKTFDYLVNPQTYNDNTAIQANYALCLMLDKLGTEENIRNSYEQGSISGLLNAVSASTNPTMRNLAVSKSLASPELLAEVAKNEKDRTVLINIAKNMNTSYTTLKMLLKKYRFLRVHIVYNPSYIQGEQRRKN